MQACWMLGQEPLMQARWMLEAEKGQEKGQEEGQEEGQEDAEKDAEEAGQGCSFLKLSAED